MSLPKLISQLCIIFASACLMGEKLSATENPNDTWLPHTLQIKVENEGLPGVGSIFRAYVSSGTNQFFFVMPADFRLANSTLKKLSLVSTDYNYSLALRIITPPGTILKNYDAATYRGLLVARFANAKIIDESTRYVANHEGYIFDLQWNNSDGARLSARVAFVPSPAGVLEFSVISAPEKFSTGQNYFDSWLMTFGSKASSQQEVPSPSGGG